MTLKELKIELDKLDDSLEVYGHSRLNGTVGLVYNLQEAKNFPAFRGKLPANVPDKFIIITML